MSIADFYHFVQLCTHSSLKIRQPIVAPAHSVTAKVVSVAETSSAAEERQNSHSQASTSSQTLQVKDPFKGNQQSGPSKGEEGSGREENLPASSSQSGGSSNAEYWQVSTLLILECMIWIRWI